MKIMETDELLIYEYAIYKNIKKTTINEYKIAVKNTLLNKINPSPR